MQLQWSNNDGSYNIRDPKNNSNQDYIGDFYEPTERKLVQEQLIGHVSTDISTVDKSVDFNDYQADYLTSYELLPKQEMTQKQKYYQFIKESFNFLDEDVLSAEDKKQLKDSDYGVSSLKKYPLNDEVHVRQAIRMFNYVDSQHEKELAINIKKKIKQYNIDISNISSKNRLSNYIA